MNFEQVSLILGGRGFFEGEDENFKAYRWFGTEVPDPRLIFEKIDNGLSLRWSE